MIKVNVSDYSKEILDFIELENLIDSRVIAYFSNRSPQPIPMINHYIGDRLVKIKFIYNSLTDVWDLECDGYLLENYIYELKDTEKVKRELGYLIFK